MEHYKNSMNLAFGESAARVVGAGLAAADVLRQDARLGWRHCRDEWPAGPAAMHRQHFLREIKRIQSDHTSTWPLCFRLVKFIIFNAKSIIVNKRYKIHHFNYKIINFTTFLVPEQPATYHSHV